MQSRITRSKWRGACTAGDGSLSPAPRHSTMRQRSNENGITCDLLDEAGEEVFLHLPADTQALSTRSVHGTMSGGPEM